MPQSNRHTNATLLRLTFAATVALAPLPASAFEIFGLTFFESDDEDDTAVIDPLNYTVTLEVAPGPGDTEALEESLRSASTLIADEDDPVSGSLGLLSKARGDRKRLVAALYENARYDGLAYIYIGGRRVSDLPPDTEFAARPVPVTIRVQPGPVYELGRIDVSPGLTNIDPAEYGLVSGGSAASVDVLDGEARLLSDIRETGRPFAAVTARDTIADAARDRLDYRLSVSPGETVPFGTTYVKGAQAVDPGFVAYMAGIKAGEVFSPGELRQARDRLVDLDVFSSVTVREAKGQAADGTLPVQVEVAERNFGFYGIGATYSNTEGAGTSGYVGYRNLFGRAESLRLDASVSRIGGTAVTDSGREIDGVDYSTSLVFKKPGVLGPDSVYIGSIGAGREQPLPYDREYITVDSRVEYDIDDNQTVSVGIAGEFETIGDYFGETDYQTGSVPITYTFDNRDNELNPTEGFLIEGQFEPSYSFSNSTAFLRARAQAATYLSLTESDRYILAGRVAYGNVFGADLEDVPNDERFFAGGGGSVRGYEYLSIGPYFPSSVPEGSDFDETFTDTPRGGLSLFEASAEARIGVTENIQVVPFVDFGAVGDELTPDFSNLKIGYGIGARYLTSFGPIRIDVGLPVDPGPRDADFQIYAGIGQAF